MTAIIVVATNNPGKAREFRAMFAPKQIHIKTLADFPDLPPVAETGTTFLENAALKAQAVVTHTQYPVLADDSGLEVAALDGAPGIYSARYAGDHDDAANNAKLLTALKDVPEAHRQADFRTVLVLMTPNGQRLTTTGTVDGMILTAPRGDNGFGYDPLFYIPTLHQTLAELTAAQKNAISHRGRALTAMMAQFDQWWATNWLNRKKG